MKKHYIILTLILFATFIFRFPSLFEPFWYGDEGIFAAVARNLNFGGTLYATAWDNKPPMIYLTYALIFNVFGVSMFWLRLITAIVVLSTAAALYEISLKILGTKRALLATFIFGAVTSLRIIEGNLALTEIFMILPIILAMLIAIKRNYDYISLFSAGFLFAIASLYKQVGALEAAALGIYLFLACAKFTEFIKKGFILSCGFMIPYGVTIGYFAPKNLVGDYIFAAYTYYRIYFGESPQYQVLINILKFLPIIAAISYGFYKKIKGHVDLSHLILLWTACSFLGSYFSGRTYGHYLVQATPAFALIISSINLKPKLEKLGIFFGLVFFIPLIFLTKLLFTDFLSAGPINQIGYWKNFIEYTGNRKSASSYNSYFDNNVNRIMALDDFLRVNNAYGKSVYIWGDFPWLYAIADLKDPSRYVTSFHVFGVPNGQNEVAENLYNSPPDYIIKPPSSIGYFAKLEKLIANRYTLLAKIEDSDIFVKSK